MIFQVLSGVGPLQIRLLDVLNVKKTGNNTR